MDLTAADIIVAVGRGIKEKENIAVVEELAQALGAELARFAAHLRQRLAADGAPGWQFRPDGRAEGLYRGRHLRRDPAPGRHEGLEDHRRHQQGSQRADLLRVHQVEVP